MPNTLALFMYLLMRAMHKDCKVGTPTGVVELKRGQYISGRLKLASDLGQTEREIRTSLSRLMELQIIDQQTTSRYSIYTIVNYGQYQDCDQQTTSTTTSRRPADDQQTTTKEDIKELKALKQLKTYTPPIPETLFSEWMGVRKAKRAGNVTERVWSAIERESALAGISAIRAIEICCEKGWQGFNADWIKSNIQKMPTADNFKNIDYGVSGEL